jgi:hypothetical protein
VALVATLIVLVACESSSAAEPCWKQVQSDWTDNKRIDNTYKAQCYDKAIAKLPTDLKYYSDAPDTILAAKERTLRARDRILSSHNSDGPGSGNSSGSSSDKGGGDSPLGAILNSGPSATDDVPLPLLIIAFLALLLMGAGAAGLINRRLQARRAGPPPEGPSPA